MTAVRRSPRYVRLSRLRSLALLCAVLGMSSASSAEAAAYYSHSSSSSSMTMMSVGISTGFETIWVGGNSTTTTASTYWANKWLLETWPTPVVTNSTIVAPASSLTVAVQTEAPAAISTGANAGEFFVMDADGFMHAAPAQRPDQWLTLDAPASLPGQDGFSFSGNGIHLLTEEGFATYDPGTGVIGAFNDIPSLTEEHPVRFVQYPQAFVLPGATYRRSPSWPHAFGAQPNSGLTLPRPAGSPPETPLRPHRLSEIIYSEGTCYALGELHPETPGIAPGTQAIFKSSDCITWSSRPLPKLTGRWQALAISPGSAVAKNQFVVVGDDGIYTSLDAGMTGLHIAHNRTTATATEFTLTLPETGAPIDDILDLRLNAVAWIGDRFVAAGRTRTADGSAVYLEGLSKHWFAYPLQGWPADRTVDQIKQNLDRRLLLGKAEGPGSPAILAADVPPGGVPAGTPPTISIAPTFAPVIGSYHYVPLTASTPARRFIIEGENAAGWQASVYHSALLPPYISALNNYYHLQDDPVQLTITAVNEFGRSAPVTVTIDSKLPAPYVGDKAPELILPKKVTAVFGAAVHIPVKAKKNPNWSPSLIWAYGLPKGLSYDPQKKAVVGHALVAGTHQIQLLAFNRYSRSPYYSDIITSSLTEPITLTVGEPKAAPADAGTFSGLLVGTESLSGHWTLAIRPDRSFTGKVNVSSGAHSFRGTLTAEENLPGTYAATLVISRKKLPALEITIILHSAEGRVSVFAASGSDATSTAGGTVVNMPWANDRLTPRAGDYSAAIRLGIETDPDTAGTGFLRMQITPRGRASLRGELANGLKWTASTSLAADGHLPISAKIAKGRSVHGTLAFPVDAPAATAFGGELAWRTTVAEKCPAYGDSTTLAITGDSAPVPDHNNNTLLPSGPHKLALMYPDFARFGVGGGEATVNFFTEGNTRLVVSPYEPQNNPLRVTLRLNRQTKLASGSFTVVDEANRKRTIALRGALVTNSETGIAALVGYFLIPAPDGKTQASGSLSSHSRN